MPPPIFNEHLIIERNANNFHDDLIELNNEIKKVIAIFEDCSILEFTSAFIEIIHENDIEF